MDVYFLFPNNTCSSTIVLGLYDFYLNLILKADFENVFLTNIYHLIFPFIVTESLLWYFGRWGIFHFF